MLLVSVYLSPKRHTMAVHVLDKSGALACLPNVPAGATVQRTDVMLPTCPACRGALLATAVVGQS